MKRVRRAELSENLGQSCAPVDPRHPEAGDTLIEILIALVIMGVAAVAMLLAFATSISGSGEHRSLATFDTVLRTAAAEVTSQLQQQPSSYWTSCSGAGPLGTPGVIAFSSLHGYSAQVTSVQYWNGSNFTPPSSSATWSTTPVAPATLPGYNPCVANAPQLIQLTASNSNGVSQVINFVVDDPLITPATCSSPSKLAFLGIGQPGNVVAGTTFVPEPAVAIEDSAGNVCTGDIASVSLSISAGTPSVGGPGSLNGCTGTSYDGIVTFIGCLIDTSGTGYELQASSTGVTSANSNPFNVNAAAATQVVVTTSPSSSTGGMAFATQPVVKVEDIFGNTVTSDTSTVTLGITPGTPNPGGPGTLSGCSAVENAGVFTFSGCSINTAGTGYEVRATDGTLTLDDSNAFNITVGAAANLAFTVQPSSSTGGIAFPTQPVVTIQDAGGNTVTSNSSSVQLSIANNPSGGTLTCTSANPLPAVGGMAAFSGCSINTAGTGYTLTATDPGLSPATSSSFNISTGVAAKFVFITQPVGNVAEGTALSTQPQVAVDDAGGNLVTNDTGAVTLAVGSYTPANGGSTGGTLGCNTNPVNAVAGIATFAGCQITGPAAAGTYALTATRSGVTSGASSSFSIIAGISNKLAFTTQPIGGVAEGTNLATQPQVSVEDVNGNVVTGDTGSVTLSVAAYTAANGGTTKGTLSCTSNTVSAVAGVATFASCQITGAGGAGNYTLSAARSGLTSATSTGLAIIAGPASQLVFTQQPVGGVIEGTNFPTQPKVTVEDANGNVVTSDTGTVALSVGSYTTANGGYTKCTLSCTSNTVSAVAGVATFASCQITGAGGAGTYTLSASRSGLSPGTSTNVTINAGTATKLAFTTQPVGGVTEGTNFTTQPQVSVEDANGNVVTGDTGTVALSIGTYTAGNGGTTKGTLGCTSTTVTAVAGVATFANCQITGAGGAGTYVLSAARSGLTTATSANVTINSGAGTTLIFTTSPGNSTGGTAFAAQPKITVQDANGNVATGDSSTVTLAIATGTPTAGGPGTLSCGSQSETAGVITFSGCSINTVGTGYKLTASDASLTPVNSAAFNITLGTAAQLVFTQQPVGGVIEGTNLATQPKVTVEDAGGNVVTTDTGAVTLSIGSYTAGNGGTTQGTFACTTNPINAVAGVATFAGCKITGTAAAGTYTLTAARSGLTSGSSSSFAINAGTATKLAYTTQPVGGVNEATNFTTQPQVSVEDTNGNVVTTDTGTVALATNGYTAGNGGTTKGALSCTATTVNAVAGVATFANCQITGTAGAGTYTLNATRSGLTTATSSNVVITSGPAASLVFTTQPAGATAGTAWTTQPVVSAKDSFGNVATTASGSVVLTIATGPQASFTSGNGTVVLNNGVATYSSLVLDAAGSYTLTATPSGISGLSTTVNSNAFTVSPAAASQLVFTSEPGASTTAINFTVQPVVKIEDAFFNVTTSTASVTLSINSGTGTLACTTNPKAAVAGVATFAACKITLGTQGVFTLMAASGTLTADTTDPFTVAGAASKFVFTTSPGASTTATAFGTQPVVSVTDSSGDVVTTSVLSITLAINTGTGTLACTTNPVTAVAGVATFAGCKITLGTQGAFTLKATGTLTTGTSSSFTVAGTASKLVFTTSPGASATGVTFGTQPVVSVTDSSGDVVTTSTAAVTLAIGTGTGTLACTTNPLNAVGGVATFTGCQITAPSPGTFTLQATSSGLTSVTSSSFTVTGPATQLVFATSPSSLSASGANFTTQPVVWEEDSAGNLVTTATDSVTLVISTGTGTLSCDANPATAVGGIVTYSGCDITTGSFQTFRLQATAPGLTTGTSASFTVL